MFQQIGFDLAPFEKDGITDEGFHSLLSNCRQMIIHFQIINHNLYFVQGLTDTGHFQTRAKSSKMIVQSAVSQHNLPDMEFLLITHDGVVYPGSSTPTPLFGYCKNSEAKEDLYGVVVPDFTFWTWPEAHTGYWKDTFESLVVEGKKIPFAQRDNKLFFRGQNSPRRKAHMENAIRHGFDNVQDAHVGDKFNYATLQDHCQYKYLLHLAGNNYSSRMKYLLACGSIVFFMEDPNIEFYYHALTHMKHIVKVKSFEEIKAHIAYFESNVTAAEEIAHNARQFVLENLNPAMITCYVAELLQQYANLVRYPITLHPRAVRMDDVLFAADGLNTP
jgi:hypothetical protein